MVLPRETQPKEMTPKKKETHRPPSKVPRLAGRTEGNIALNKPFMEVDGIGQLSRFHRIINYGTQIVSLKKSQSAANIWNFP